MGDPWEMARVPGSSVTALRCLERFYLTWETHTFLFGVEKGIDARIRKKSAFSRAKRNILLLCTFYGTYKL
jgi:hypothetical protein